MIKILYRFGRVSEMITSKCQQHFKPTQFQLVNESNRHSVPKGSETHFKMIIVSNKFENVSRIERHRAVNEVLQQELQNDLIALSITAKTQKEWDQSQEVNNSPNCKGGTKFEKGL